MQVENFRPSRCESLIARCPLPCFGHGIVPRVDRLALLLRIHERSLDVTKNLKLPLVKDASRFLKSLRLNIPRLVQSVQECQKELLALKLGIISEAFDANIGFYEFAKMAHLAEYLRLYNEKLDVDENSLLISIKYQGRMTPWNEVYGIFHDGVYEIGRWLYGPDGVQNESFYCWEVLKPYKPERLSTWGPRYLLTFCVYCTDQGPRRRGDHSWIYLQTPKGEIFSVGLWAAAKGGCARTTEGTWLPLATQEGLLQSPDESDFWPEEFIRRVSAEIDEASFERIKNKVETDQRENNLVFHPLGPNCVKYINGLASLAGINFIDGVRKPSARLLTPRRLEPAEDALERVLPTPLTSACKYVAAVFLNCVQLGLGSGRVDRRVRQKPEGHLVRPHLPHWGSLFDASKNQVCHPHHLGIHVFGQIRRWREEEKARILQENDGMDSEEIKARLEKIDYTLPPEMYLTQD